ncbi:MAG: TlpA disulfide reductase family protein [Nonlabens sp.]
MSRVFLIIFFIGCCISCTDHRPTAVAQVIDRTEFKAVLNSQADKVQVINFWATWCAPCVEELPAFEELGKNYQDQVEVILVSLDDIENIDKLVNPFLSKLNIKSQVKLLDDPYAAEWIPLVDSHWDGAIPVTLVKTNNSRRFYNQTFTYEELEKAINEYL